MRNYFNVIESYENIEYRKEKRTVWIFTDMESAKELIEFLNKKSDRVHNLHIEEW